MKFKQAKNCSYQPVKVGGWEVGDEVTFWMKENERWRKGILIGWRRAKQLVRKLGIIPPPIPWWTSNILSQLGCQYKLSTRWRWKLQPSLLPSRK